MSFDFTSASAASFKPKVENTFLGKGGGGGNTGYFRQKKKKGDEKDTSIMTSLLSEDKLDRMSTAGMPSFDEEKGFMEKLKGFMGKIV